MKSDRGESISHEAHFAAEPDCHHGARQKGKVRPRQLFGGHFDAKCSDLYGTGLCRQPRNLPFAA